MPGGTWSLQNKLRPGAYVDFTAASYWSGIVKGNGIVALPYEMSWGAEHELITVRAEDMRNGNCKKLLGYGADHRKILAVAEALKNCGTVLVYRVNDGGFKASATLGALTVSAKYPGARGNDICVAVEGGTDAVAVVTYVDSEEADRQELAPTAVPRGNDWVTFTLNGSMSSAAATALSGGSDGTAAIEDYEAYWALMKSKAWQVMAMPKAEALFGAKLSAYIRDLRENCGKKVQGVVCGYDADYEGIINVTQGYARGDVVVSAAEFTAWAAGAAAGASIAQSNTYREVADATAILDEVAADSVEGALADGIFLLSRRTDGTIVVEQDINSLTTFGDYKSRVFSKNRVIRCLDRIANGVADLFEVNYIGTISNNAEGRDLFKQDLIGFMRELMALGAIEDFDGAEDILVSEGADADSVRVSLAVRPVDSMEKLYITVEVA